MNKRMWSCIVVAALAVAMLSSSAWAGGRRGHGAHHRPTSHANQHQSSAHGHHHHHAHHHHHSH